MFLQRIPRKKGDEVYDYWALTKTVRTANGPRHQIVSYLGKLDAGDQDYYHSWDDIASLLDGRRDAVQGDLFERPKPIPEWREINVSGIEVKRVREFGQVWAALAIWRRLGLDRLFAGLMPEGREDIRWDLIACVLTAAKFCEQDTENAVAGEWLTRNMFCARAPTGPRRSSRCFSGSLKSSGAASKRKTVSWPGTRPKRRSQSNRASAGCASGILQRPNILNVKCCSTKKTRRAASP